MQVKHQLGSLSTLVGSRALHGLGWQGPQESCSVSPAHSHAYGSQVPACSPGLCCPRLLMRATGTAENENRAADGGGNVHRIPRGVGKENTETKRGKGSAKDVL